MQTSSPNELKIKLPRPYPLQSEILQSPAKRKVINAGRRVGKTTLASIAAAQCLLSGKRALLSSTSQEQADVFWRYIRGWLRPLTDHGIAYKNETRRIIALGDGEIRVKTGSDADALRGDNVSLLVLDECARLNPTAWQEVGAPMLADSNGDAMFISTPKRRNWFFNLYQRAIADDSGIWQAWSFTTHANPFITQQALDLLISDMTESAYQQEILAQFLEGEGAVFRYVTERCTAPRQQPYYGEFVYGLDWGRQNDYTVMVVMDRETRTVVDYDRFNQVDWSLQRGRVRAMIDKWKCRNGYAESNSIGSPNIEALQHDGIPISAFETTASSKPPLIESLVLAFDRNEITVLNDPIIVGELMAYEAKTTASGRTQYSAPEGLHDDCVIALALAWKACMGGVSVSYAPDLGNYLGV
jgi:hypothetical protein